MQNSTNFPFPYPNFNNNPTQNSTNYPFPYPNPNNYQFQNPSFNQPQNFKIHLSTNLKIPTAWEGQFTRGDKGTTTVILEAVASHDLWIWHAFFGCPGTLNDINVLDRSPVFDDVEQGNTPRVKFFVNQRRYDMAYYLADGIYPSYPTFVKSITLPQSEQDKLFAQRQEGCRKDIERAFGVLQARFKIIREPARMWDITDLAIIMRSCIILHNMIVEDERETYAQHWNDYDQSEASGSSTQQPFSTEVLPVFANHVHARSDLRDSNVHHELQADLVKHIWAQRGMFGGE
ncbi:uncharacterized protein LOC110225249 [Arabidopsis lyrata subsp. lyrata]|uniref:uncharacterized protein LOC110225249 n=1 Tax=Arabidopsis lyrata subsp. lyrata TaxID=81972 RepID=UPI000A29DA7B|nr:uncharacterized protein LOC110225249 [Arabidopsis lyrata subsp. lyrata]|eukprot:XP_020870157.1 uncharacterized protein LOC110225249 [Arabidopsis lyrata subsp. lyrata]